jgi:hypothetical protein
MVSKYLCKDDLCQLLQINERKKYSLHELEKYMTPSNLKKATTVFSSYKGVCNCGNCVITKNNFLSIIKQYLIIDESEPSCHFFQFNQKPIEIYEL